jgi:hypothetical protein
MWLQYFEMNHFLRLQIYNLAANKIKTSTQQNFSKNPKKSKNRFPNSLCILQRSLRVFLGFLGFGVVFTKTHRLINQWLKVVKKVDFGGSKTPLENVKILPLKSLLGQNPNILSNWR